MPKQPPSPDSRPTDETEIRFRAALTRALSGPYVPPEPSSKGKVLARKTKPRR